MQWRTAMTPIYAISCKSLCIFQFDVKFQFNTSFYAFWKRTVLWFPENSFRELPQEHTSSFVWKGALKPLFQTPKHRNPTLASAIHPLENRSLKNATVFVLSVFLRPLLSFHKIPQVEERVSSFQRPWEASCFAESTPQVPSSTFWSEIFRRWEASANA